ncbi:MAG: hypothetical protein ACI4CC_09245 [Lachnospiraceae bacterium]
MEHYVNEKIVMQFYLKQMEENKIIFLQGHDSKKQQIRGLIEEMIWEETMNRKIRIACNLWKNLFEASMSYISPEKQGYDKLFQYFDAYVEFEELIFASDSFYRDHTLHCIWVYFLGEYLRRKEEFTDLFVDEQKDLNLLEVIPNALSQLQMLKEEDADRLSDLIEMEQSILKNDEAVRCVAALTHDLGYPLKKIEKINKSMKKVLPFFAIHNFEDFTFEYGNIQQEFVSQFIDFISRSVSINIDGNNSKQWLQIVQKLFEINEFGNVVGVKDEAIRQLSEEEKAILLAGSLDVNVSFASPVATRLSFYNDFEEYKHGIMSAFLLCKNLRAFQQVDYMQDGSGIRFNGRYPADTVLSLQRILSSISNHTNDMFRITTIDPDTFLTFVDELEEFSRISRASQNREFVEEFCDTALYMEDGWLHIDFEFNNASLDNLNPEISFKGRCKRFLTLFDIKELSNNLKICVTCQGKLPTDQNTYQLKIAHCYADISINGESVNIPEYLKSDQFFSREEYEALA